MRIFLGPKKRIMWGITVFRGIETAFSWIIRLSITQILHATNIFFKNSLTMCKLCNQSFKKEYILTPIFVYSYIFKDWFNIRYFKY